MNPANPANPNPVHPASPASRAPWLAFLLSLAGIALAVLLVREHLTAYSGDAVSGPFCGGGGYYDCARVAAHPSSWMLGVPTAAWGMLLYVVLAGLSLAALAVRGGERAAALALGSILVALALIVDAWLAYVMLVQIGTVCLMCVGTYALNLGIAGVFWWLSSRAGERPDWRSLFVRWRPAAPAEASAAAASDAAAAPAPAGRGIQIEAKLVVAVLTVVGITAVAMMTGQSAIEAHAIADYEARRFFDDTDTVRVDMRLFDGQPSRGPADAKVPVVVAGDFQCTWCRGLANNLERLREEFPDRIRVTFINSPLSPACNPMIESHEADTHTESCVLAVFAECAEQQGKFWQYHDFVYDRIPLKHVRPENVERLFTKIGLDPARMEACVGGGEAQAALDRDVAIFNQLQLSGAPTLIVDGRMKVGGISPRALRTIVLRVMQEK